MLVFQALHLGVQFSLHSASSLFGTQHQLTHPPLKNSTIPLRKMPVFQGVAPRHTIFTSSCVIPLWDSAITHSPFGKELNPCSQEDTRFSGRCTLAYKFYLALRHPSLGLSNSSLTLRKKLKLSSLEESYFSRLFVLLMFSHYPALGSLYFGTYPYYSLNPYVHYYLWSISIAKDRRFAYKRSPRRWWS